MTRRIHTDAFTGEEFPQSIYHDNPTLKYFGDPNIIRRDAGHKVTGQAKFANDIMLANLCYLKFKRCPHTHARVTSIDTSAAEALPGVIRVYTHDDVPSLTIRPPYNFVLMNETFEQGGEVAAVVAEDEDIAEEACALIDVEYEVLPFVLYAKEALEPGAPIVFGDTNEVGTPWTHTRGDPAAGFNAADEVVEVEVATVTKPWSGDRPVAPIEGESIVCEWENNQLRFWVATQGHHYNVRIIGPQVGLPYNRVIGEHTYEGASFGLKGSSNKGSVLAAYAAMDTNRPVKFMVEPDGQMNINTSTQSAQNHSYKIGVKNDGTLTAFSDINIQASGSYGGAGGASAVQLHHMMFNVPNMYLEARNALTNTNGTGVPRCVHHPMSTFSVGVAMDQAAETIDMDPADFLIKNLFRGEGVGTHQDWPEWELDSNPNPDMVEKLVNNSGWKSKWNGWTTPVSVSGSKARGIGIAAHECDHGRLSNPMSAMVKANLDGTFDIDCGSFDIGTGFRTQGAIIAAEELGTPVENVNVSRYNTDTTQESMLTGGSRVTRASGTAIILACQDIKEQLFYLAVATGKLPGPATSMSTGDGNIYQGSESVTIAEVCALQQSTHVVKPNDPSFKGGPLIGRGSYATKRAAYMCQQWNTAIAEVEVDTDTGEVEVLKMWTAEDVGRVIFRKGLENQQYGGSIMSMGRALFEGIVKDDATGVTLNPNYLDYKIPSMADIPDYDIDLYETYATNPFGPMGAKGVGEPMVGGTAPSIANAIYNACGARVNSTMITPNKILEAIGKG